MIVLFNPLSTQPGKQPLPLSLLSLAAVLEPHERWTLVDGNVSRDPAADILAELDRHPASEFSMLAVTVMNCVVTVSAAARRITVRTARRSIHRRCRPYAMSSHRTSSPLSSVTTAGIPSERETEIVAVPAGTAQYA